MRGQDPPQETAVLLVCIYNQFGNVITHDYLYQLFSPHGTIVKILIFQKAKVWKTFVEYTSPSEAEKALLHLNNKVIFEDGSKMNIFRSKLKHVQFQNDNLGGVNYQQLQERQEWNPPVEEHRKRRSTFQDYIVPFYAQEPTPITYYQMEKDSGHESTSAKYGSQSLSAHGSQSINANPNSSFNANALFDIEEQFREIALQSEEFKAWEQTEEVNRRKSKTIVNPHSQQFLLQNCPSKVLFVRSLPQQYDHDCAYNIFSNFGRVNKVIFIADKNSALVEFQSQKQAIQAKDQINYAKPSFKVFYSHYQSLILKPLAHNEQEHDYKSEGLHYKSPNFNPPSEILYCTLLSPNHEEELRELCQGLGCPIHTVEWRQNTKDKWMCLLEFASLNDSLLAMGKLQNHTLKNGRKIRLSFTRSRLRNKNYVSKHVLP